MTTILSIFLIGLIETGSMGFMHDPLVDGVSVKLGAIRGIRGNFLISFGSGETQVDSSQYLYTNTTSRAVYEQTFYRPYSWINMGMRAEYHFTNHQWYQPYIGLGFEGKKESRWESEWSYNDTTQTTTPKKISANYWGPTASAGLTFYPIVLFGKVFKLEIPFAKALTFNVEICSYYLLTHDFNGIIIDDGWISYTSNHEFSGIGTGIGIHYSW
jgi:hypothetical protein